ncbi:hypothetical protein CONLIGDRAFT_637495 [Coniochaeta ligniaria NRRL 30616]|uniref:F-box domain-containing protein n=1 Tax=Coniochaeta ligniaria NRRL 30616 TaxID=1408157 RepID=A0A1J7J0Z1_9PEZI|nr:hypothetical protein CONLIGDRAFT_637495 [Coniochaeta ligniaria NRRL 30616]
MASPTSTAIETLPPELISHIFFFLDGPAPSDVRLRDQPSPSMLASPDAPLKAVSRVSKRWRAIALPVLFRHILWAFDRWDLVFPDAGSATFDAAGNPITLPLLSFIRENNLGRCVESLTLVVSDRMYGQYRLSEAGNAANGGASSARDADLHLEEDMRSLLTDARARSGWTSRWRQHSARSEDSNWLWELLLGAMDPKRFTIIALPRMLASLLSRMVFLGDAWSFRDQYHILSLDRRTPESLEKWKPAKHRTNLGAGRVEGQDTTSAGPSEPWSDPTKPIKTVLFTIRPWTSVLLNEGSSTRVYKTYEFFLKRPPSILGSLLGCEEAPNDEPLIPPSVRSLSYVAMFPLSSHFNSLVNHLPQLDNLYLQLVPRNDILDNKDEMRNIQVSDLWMERNTCYSLVMRALFGAEMGIGWDDEDLDPENGWSSLKVFESGDAADKEAWDMAVEYVRMSGTPWTVVADGVLVKDGPRRDSEDPHPGLESPAGSSDTHGNPEDDPSAGFELFKGQLEVLAFHGSAELPYSAAGHYLTSADELEIFHL